MSIPPKQRELEVLRRLHQNAIEVISLTAWRGAIPDYHPAIPAFMKYITTSNWCYPSYQPSQFQALLEQIENANMLEIQSIFTAIARSERFCDGSWQQFLESGVIASAITRVGELMNEIRP